jgi:hypothetical protein
MTFEPQNDRIVNGLLKADIGLQTPEEVEKRLSQDVLIRVDPSRSGSEDLWPCIWFLASILERQFFGQIFISANLRSPLPAPVPFGPRCVFVDADFVHGGPVVGIGAPAETDSAIWGDARGRSVTYQSLADSLDRASPTSCCALAGYLGFAALAHAAGVPSFHIRWAQKLLVLPLLDPLAPIPRKIAILGGGQVGQAFLSLSYFVAAGQEMEVHLVDYDLFEKANYRSQLLLSEDSELWDRRLKVEFLAGICKRWGWIATNEKTRITWGWKNPLGVDSVAFLGFDNMEARRVAVEGGFTRLVECGVGTDFSKPRVSWHSLPPDRQVGRQLFVEPRSAPLATSQDSEFLRSLDDTPGGCGRVKFENIQATAPCLGALAAAFTWTELLNYSAGESQIISGGAYAWSPLQPIQRDIILSTGA